jgi:hypothetical protein
LRRGLTRQAGFSLLEVVITIAIMMTLTVAVASMLRGGFEVKEGLSQRAKLIHRMQVAIDRIAKDVELAFLVSTVKDQNKNPMQRRTKSIFKIDRFGGGEKLLVTTKTHRPIVKGSYESDMTFVVYELRDAPDAAGRKHLYRGESPVIPEDLKEEPPKSVLARHIKSVTYEAWDGEKWMKDAWDTGRGDTRNRLPKLMRITLEAYKHDRIDGDGQDAAALDEETEKISTVVYLSESWAHQEIKQPSKTPRWEGL